MDEVLAFQSATFPAHLASDPDATPEASGRACLQYILDGIQGPTISARGEPISEGSGFTAVVDSLGTTVAIHLTWFAEGPPRGTTRDVWTIQIWRTGGLLRDLMRRIRGKEDQGLQAVTASVTRLLRERAEEFSELRECTWKDLER